eukprot:TRINITY_DN29859_c0_g1_i1.p1 TRINITY_DN29859_c0_g1~~TRINITY_DN29859_c0_g1_i1.p1  ORF type:complete len:533 (+),score=90.73 TRINITY_DN29859_c0_g1_i1:32-1600(+)
MAHFRMLVLRMDRLWWWIALVAVLSLLSHEIARSSGFGMVSATELEGFGEEDGIEVEDEESIIPVVTPTVRPVVSGFQTEKGPPSNDGSASDEDDDESAEDELSVDDAGEDFQVPIVAPIRLVEEVAEQAEMAAASLWDEDEFEGVPPPGAEPLTGNTQQTTKDKKANRSNASSNRRRPTGPSKPLGPSDFIIEGATVIFLILYGINFWFGKQANEKVAVAWARQFAAENSVFEKNFSLLGTGDGVDEPLITKDTQNTFKFYASGRRYVDGLLATLDLQYRHDLITMLWYRVAPKTDTVTIEVWMADEYMEPFVLAVTKKRSVKLFQRENKDLKELGSIIDFSARRRWPSDELAVISDSKEAALEILSEPLVDQLFSEKVFDKNAASLFVSLHFSDQLVRGTHKKCLLFTFNLPPADRMADLTRLIAAIPVFIDNVGRFKLSSTGKIKAESARMKALEDERKEELEQRQEAVLRKKEEKLRAEAAKRAEWEARLSPEQLNRLREKERAKAAKKAVPRPKMIR